MNKKFIKILLALSVFSAFILFNPIKQYIEKKRIEEKCSIIENELQNAIKKSDVKELSKTLERIEHDVKNLECPTQRREKIDQDIDRAVDLYYKKIIEKFGHDLDEANNDEEVDALVAEIDSYLLAGKILPNRFVSLENKFHDRVIEMSNKRRYDIKIANCKTIENDIDAIRRIVSDYYINMDEDSEDVIDTINTMRASISFYESKIREIGCPDKVVENIEKMSSQIRDDLKVMIVEYFLNQFDIFENLSDDMIEIVKNYKIDNLTQEIDRISDIYSNEITSFSPISTDRDIVEKYLVEPFKDAIIDYKSNLQVKLNELIFDKMDYVYEKFFRFCDENEIEYRINENIAKFPLVEFNSDIEKEIENISTTLKESGVLWNAADELASWLPIAGDIKDIFEINICKTLDENKECAKSKMNKFIKQYLMVYLPAILGKYNATLENSVQQILIDTITLKGE